MGEPDRKPPQTPPTPTGGILEKHTAHLLLKPLGAAHCRLHLQVKVRPSVTCPGPHPWPPCLLALHGVGQVCATACTSPRRIPAASSHVPHLATPARSKQIRGARPRCQACAPWPRPAKATILSSVVVDLKSRKRPICLLSAGRIANPELCGDRRNVPCSLVMANPG